MDFWDTIDWPCIMKHRPPPKKKIFNPLGMYTSRPAMFTEYRVFYGPCPRMFYMEMLFSLV